MSSSRLISHAFKLLNHYFYIYLVLIYFDTLTIMIKLQILNIYFIINTYFKNLKHKNIKMFYIIENHII